MPHRSTLARRKMKETEPDKYALYLARTRQAKQKKRDEEKREWEENTHTRAQVEERELKKENKRYMYRYSPWCFRLELYIYQIIKKDKS